jgi:hypothetical protein
MSTSWVEFAKLDSFEHNRERRVHTSSSCAPCFVESCQALLAVMNLTDPQRRILRSMANGDFLKAHRDLEGDKAFKLHPREGATERVDRADVDALVEAGLIDSNKKFPAATFWLTEKGRAAARPPDTGS